MKRSTWIPVIAGVALALVALGGCSTTSGPSASNPSTDPFATQSWQAGCPGGTTYGARGPCGPPSLSVY